MAWLPSLDRALSIRVEMSPPSCERRCETRPGTVFEFRSPNHRKDVIKLERGQKRFTEMLPGLEGLRYEERLVFSENVFLGVKEAEGYPCRLL